MKKVFLMLVAGITIFATSSFQANSGPDIVGHWQAMLIDIPSNDSLVKATMKSQLEQVDELDEVDSGMVARYHTTNLKVIKEKARVEINEQPEQTRMEIEKKTKGIKLDLNSDHKGVITFSEPGKNVRWYFADNNSKVLFDPFEVDNAPSEDGNQVMIFDIVYVKGDDMRLKVHQDKGQANVFVNFHRSAIANSAGRK